MELLSRHKVCLIGWPIRWNISDGFSKRAKELLRRIDLRTGIILRTYAPSIDHARRIVRKWRSLF
ncbi:MAG: hypothetical protein DRZ82_09125 [Thermoprotei archaeon]|nr:MAG: hypothetical protein DRZ82_09125 [Thermoprotei archaeon]